MGGLSGNLDLALSNNISAAVALTVGGNNQNNTYSGNLSGTGSLTKIGTGNFTLSGNLAYTGNTTISTGTLFLNGNTSTGALTINSGATLAGNGEVGGDTNINGTLLPGNVGNPGLLTFSQNLTLGANSTSSLQIEGGTPGTQYSAVDVGGNLSFGGTLAVTLLNSFLPALNTTFDLFPTIGSLSGAFATLLLPILNSDLAWNTSQLDTTGDVSVVSVNFNEWTADNDLSGNDALPAASPFGGSTANLIRYAMNLDTSATPAQLPTTTLVNTDGTNYLTIQYRVRKDMSDYQLVPQSSTDLVIWNDVDPGNITQQTDADTYTAQFQASVVLPASGTVFLRVVAEQL